MIILAALLLTYIESDGKKFSQHFLLLLLIIVHVFVCDMPPLLKCSPFACVCFVHRCTMEEISWVEGAKKLSIQHFLLSLSILSSFLCVCVFTLKMFYYRRVRICVMLRHFMFSRIKKKITTESEKNKSQKTSLSDVTRLFMRHQ